MPAYLNRQGALLAIEALRVAIANYSDDASFTIEKSVEEVEVPSDSHHTRTFVPGAVTFTVVMPAKVQIKPDKEAFLKELNMSLNELSSLIRRFVEVLGGN